MARFLNGPVDTRAETVRRAPIIRFLNTSALIAVVYRPRKGRVFVFKVGENGLRLLLSRPGLVIIGVLVAGAIPVHICEAEKDYIQRVRKIGPACPC